ncbi:alkyl hydroperoxide reductase subunit F [Hydrogenivirga caldilitoris]|uniref:Alkyl hydroperoxide reductase subunit F n=1 Tax=Hydrogenivirga caldilitoris TaxID=246264 RepID=A0A497XRV1_9AQUI|nr:FAD-dependent oxidoreductase [Hydrogenivirga caldilitoris]RLJ71004.1 alkyl hydroperoxide reductase subunit F [Hydrogenivirga caldilitoris]
MYKVVIVGGGPAGISASIYAARKKLNFLLVTEAVGGQVLTSGEIENFLGYSEIDGVQLVEKMMEHMKHFEIEPLLDRVVEVRKEGHGFSLKTMSGKEISSQTLLLCTGSDHRRLNVPGESEYTGRGVSYCYTCDAPFFKGARVVVVGGGNAGFEAAEQLINYAEEVYIVEVTDSVRADEVLKDKVLSSPKVKLLLKHAVKEVKGDGARVTGVVMESLTDGKVYELPVEGVFVEIGLVPRTELAEQLGILRNERGEIVVDCNNRTSERGVYAAGDCTSIFAKQIITAAGEGAKALLSLYHDITYST